jgi:hypothetical protein
MNGHKELSALPSYRTDTDCKTTWRMRKQKPPNVFGDFHIWSDRPKTSARGQFSRGYV